MKKFTAVTAVTTTLVVVLAVATTATASDWRGLYLESQISVGRGDHSLSYGNDNYGINAELYNFPISGNGLAIGGGYRFALGQSGLRLGLEGMARFGGFTGSQSWQAPFGLADASASFSAGTVYTVALQAGYALPQRPWYIYGELGYSATEAAVCGNVRILGASAGDCARGLVTGPYWAIGASRSLADLGMDRWALGIEYQRYGYGGSSDPGQGLGKISANAEQGRLSVTMSYEF
jgi:hypothetical protein